MLAAGSSSGYYHRQICCQTLQKELVCFLLLEELKHFLIKETKSGSPNLLAQYLHLNSSSHRCQRHCRCSKLQSWAKVILRLLHPHSKLESFWKVLRSFLICTSASMLPEHLFYSPKVSSAMGEQAVPCSVRWCRTKAIAQADLLPTAGWSFVSYYFSFETQVRPFCFHTPFLPLIQEKICFPYLKVLLLPWLGGISYSLQICSTKFQTELHIKIAWEISSHYFMAVSL